MVLQVTGTDFGTQNAPFISPQTYCDLYQPFHKQVNDWVHAHTGWKTFIHTDGALMPLMPHFVAAGFDILNPVQFTAKGMEPETVKAKFGENLTLWGAGDTQKVLPSARPTRCGAGAENIRALRRAAASLARRTTQPPTPVENLLAMYETVAEMRAYPIR